jgi:hypothetical protein
MKGRMKKGMENDSYLLVDGLSLIHHNEERCVDCFDYKRIFFLFYFIFSNFVLFSFFEFLSFHFPLWQILVRLYTAHSTNGRIYYEYTNRQLKEYAPYLMSVLLFFMSLSAPTDMQLIIIFNSVKRRGKEKDYGAATWNLRERKCAGKCECAVSFLKFDSIIISSWQKTKERVNHFFRETKESPGWLDGFGFCHSWMEWSIKDKKMGQVNRNWKLLEGGLPFHLLSWAREGLSASSPHRRPTSIFTWRQSDSDKSFTEKWIFISPVSSPAAIPAH